MAKTPIGECPCPTKGCELTVPVFQYARQAPKRNATRRGSSRKAGKLYVRCPEHGLLEPQSFIEANAKITGEREPVDAPPPSKTETPDPATPDKPKAKPKSRTWGFLNV